MKQYLSILFFVIFATSCSVKRFLPDGERLYRGAKIEVERHPETKTSVRNLKSKISVAAKPRPNKFLLGQPWKVWWYYTIGEPKRKKGLRAFLRNRLGEEPVLSSRVNTKATAENMTSLLDNNGYFRSSVSGDTVNTGYFTKAIYKAYVNPQYTLSDVEWMKDSSEIMQIINTERTQRNAVLKKGNGYSLDDIKAERSRIDLALKTRGYYYFNPDYLMSYADSTIGNRQVKLYLNIKRDAPEHALHPYTINQIMVYPNYSLGSPLFDTSKVGLREYKGILIQDSTNRYRPDLFSRTITYDTGSVYSSRRQNSTLNRFINLTAFKFVKNTFERTNDTSTYRLNANYYLTPSPKKSLQGEVDGFYKDNNYLGSQLSLNFRNRNAMRGAEQLLVKGYGGFEMATDATLKGNNNYRLGASSTLRVPKYVLPFGNISESNYYQPVTNFSIGYDWFRKTLLYTRNAFTFQYDFAWKPTYQKLYSFSPVSLSYVRASNITDSFYRLLNQNPSMLLNVNSEVILGSFIQYNFNTTLPNAKNQFFYGLGADLSGNIAGLIMGAKSFRSKSVFGVPFAQYVKLDANAHYTRKLNNGMSWANRLDLGVGIPYSNSVQLPFSKQYIIGGASSIRGFNSRGLGPGRYKPTAEDQRYFQLIGGDIRLLANTELRIPITGMFGTAVFLDAGNIWKKDSLMFGVESQFSKNWAKEIAVAGGAGIRVDLNFILIRFDVGIPFRKPYLPEKERWVFDKIDFGSRDWRRENIVLNFALGLPF